MAFTGDQKTQATAPSPGNSQPGHLRNDPPNVHPPNMPNTAELDQDMTTGLDRIDPPTLPLVGETDVSSSNTNNSWEQVPEATSGGSRLSK